MVIRPLRKKEGVDIDTIAVDRGKLNLYNGRGTESAAYYLFIGDITEK